ncbi:non-functional pseudokinase ZED1-like isoform X2 [Herrania umbratica]|nr:non-functional pseudokinase ZED1-like isoform X2 [Herrania umbratica]XP_021282863.1 non-functional pseudokinase ZED1-like isoform X2 [Herrania umbratica]XP_021282864.1 non-functional pseudokinase ZED1-like isoform X2 [Herrania umbratica]
MTLLSRIRTMLKSKEEKAFIRNGSILLQELIALCNGKCNPICGFSAKELERATNNYDLRRVLHVNRFYKFYKGFLRDQPVLIKKFKGKFERREVVFNEIVIASVMSVHKNVLKLLGCCLETKVPTLVFEFAESRNLGDLVSSQNYNCHFQPLSWRCRLKIAMDIANVVAYLHTAFPKPIIHCDIRCLNIFLSEDCTAKLSDFSVSRSLSADEVDAKDEVPEIMGLPTAEYMAKQDVYSVGILMLMLLTGQKEICKDPLENNKRIYIADYVKNYDFDEILDPMILREMLLEEVQQVEAFKALVMNCICESAGDRPTMTDVAKELRRINQRSFMQDIVHITNCRDSSSPTSID